jgi:multidrug resistance protein, MATE family
MDKALNKEIFRLAVPNIVSNLSIPVLGIVDIALVGRLSSLHIGAVGLGGMLFGFLYWNFGFLRIGTTGITAQAFGAGHSDLQFQTLLRAVLLALLLGSVLLLLSSLLLPLGLNLLNVPVESSALVSLYFQTRIWDAPAVLLLYAFNGWFFGRQNTWLPMLVTLGINLSNMALSFYWVHWMDWGIVGVAWGTVCAQYLGIGVYVCVVFFLLPKRLGSWLFPSLLLGKEWGRFVRINQDFFLRNLSLSLAFGFFYRQSAGLGAPLLAVNTVLLQYLNVMSYGVDGFAHAAESLVGKYKGARNTKRLEQSIVYCLWWGGGLAAGYALVYGWGGRALLSVFTVEEALIQRAVAFLPWMVALPFVGFVCYLWDGIFGGLTASKEMRNTMGLALLSFLGATLALVPILGNHGLWLGLAIFLGVRGFGQSWIYVRKREELMALS